MSRSAAIGIGVAAVAAFGGGALWLAHYEAAPSAAEQWPLFAQYCSDCHNRDDYTAEIAFERLSAESIAHEPEIFEAVVRKLRGAQMPPPGAPQPDAATRRAWVAGLEGSLDAAAVTGAVFIVVCFVTPAQLGLGDAKLAVLLALTTAWLSPTATVWAFVSGFVLAGLWAAVMLLRGRSGRTGLPLGPFLTLGAAASVLAILAG